MTIAAFFPAWFLYLTLVLFALIVGSFLNLLIYRLPLSLKQAWTNECECLLRLPKTTFKPLNLFLPRSFCPNCKHTIYAKHNVPLLSFLLLRGRCAYCRHPISMRYPLVELLSVGLSLLAAWHFGWSWPLLPALLFIYSAIALTFIDIDHQLLPDSLVLSLLWLGLIANTQTLFTSLEEAVWGAVIAYLSLWVLIKLYYLLTGKIGMGHGDFKLFAALGAWFGPFYLPMILVIAASAGSIFGLAFIYYKKQDRHTLISFGPFLCLAGLIVLWLR